MSWSAIAVTCRHENQASDLEKELKLLKKKGALPQDAPIHLISDPCGELGSGGSTLNALLVVTEHLSATSNYTVLNPDVLNDARILIIHLGDNFAFDPCGRAFQDLGESILTESGCEVELTPFLRLFDFVTTNLGGTQAAGVWVCGSDATFEYSADFRFNWNGPRPEILGFCLPADPSYAREHGIYDLDDQRRPRRILYREKDTDIIQQCLDSEGKVPLVVALLVLSIPTAEKLLALHTIHPLSSSTYLGIDSGAIGLKLSLFFDFLLPACSDVQEAEFLKRGRANSTEAAIVDRHCERRTELEDTAYQARKLLWDVFHGTDLKIASLPVKNYHYFDNRMGSHLAFLQRHSLLFPPSSSPIFSDKPHQLNIFLTQSTLEKDRVRIAFLSLTSDANLDSCGPNPCLEQVAQFRRLYDHEFQLDDSPMIQQKVFPAISIPKGDNLDEIIRSNWSAFDNFNKFTADGELEFLSVTEICAKTRLSSHFDLKRKVRAQSEMVEVRKVLDANVDFSLLSKIKSVVLNGLGGELLLLLDSVASQSSHLGIAGRALSSIADVLGTMAAGKGGLRSGPAANADWTPSLRALEVEGLEVGVQSLANVRSNWMDSPDRLIRAARHYEAAAQVLTRKQVMRVKDQIVLKDSSAPQKLEGKWIVEAPARIDVAGGWSDTPPITNHHGGAVMNIAIKVDGKRPMGASCGKSETEGIQVVIEGNHFSQTLQFTTLADILRYSDPGKPGALICAVFVASGSIDPHQGDSSLRDQLSFNFGCSGLSLRCWSDLPQGSGLGTSSILAGCILAAVWKCMGKEFDESALLHAILYVEQLLTTGGGWQDQVGGLTPGVKIGRFGNDPATAKVTVEHAELPREELDSLGDRLLLVYTGKARLAKNLLQEVVRNWYSRRRDGQNNVVDTVLALIANAEVSFKAAQARDWNKVAETAKTYWEQKKKMAPGSEPEVVRALLDTLYGKGLITAGWLAGAGGGGFLYLMLRNTTDRKGVEEILQSEKDYASMTLHTVSIDSEPLTPVFEAH